MKPRLLDLLCCPGCQGTLTLEPSSDGGQVIVDGILRCDGCASRFAVRGGIPRLVSLAAGGAAGSPDGAFLKTQQRTQRSFGRQWQYFSRMAGVFREDLFRYLGSLDPQFFRGRLGLDAGCGFGRHAYFASELGAEMVAVDFSDAVEAAARTLRDRDNAHVVQADLYRPPFRERSFDFIYSIGVLHHLPDPEAGFRALVPLLKPGGVIMIWAYSSTRRGVNQVLESARALTTRLPVPVVMGLSYAAGAVDYAGFIWPYKLLRTLPAARNWVERLAWPRLKLYSRYPFDVVCADWFDRLAAPARAYYDAPTLNRWLRDAKLIRPQVSPTGFYGWRASGEASVEKPAAASGRQVRKTLAPLRVLVFTPSLYDTVPGQRFRIEQWARMLEGEGMAFTFLPFESSELKRILYATGHSLRKALELVRGIWRRVRQVQSLEAGAWDAIFLFRELLPVGPPILERLLARKGIPIVYDFDDAIFLGDVSEANRRYQWLKWPGKTGTICRLSRHVTVGNRYLEHYARRHTPHVSVIPTSIDTAWYQPKLEVAIDGRPVIGWSGSLTTLKHLRTIEPTLKQLRKVQDFRLKVVGSPTYALEGLEVEAHAWSTQEEVAQIQSFDVGIMPLPDDAWSQGKCGLKLLQYMALGVPTVSSPVGVNAEIIQDGANGFLASTEEEWIDKMRRLVEDRALRQRFARAGRLTVESRYAADVQTPHLRDLLTRMSRAVPGRPAEPLEEPTMAAQGT